jgi:hypothetical protein
VTEKQTGRVVHHGTKGSNPLCLVIGFFAGYATRAYMSYLRRRSKN